MHLDTVTVLLASCAALTFLGCSLLYFGRRDGNAPWLVWWSGPFLLSGLTAVSYMRLGWENEIISIGLGNAARIGALSLLWQGARVFNRRKPLLWTIAALPALWLALCTIPAFVDSLAARVVGVSAFNIVICGLAAFELWQGRAERLPSRIPAVAVFSVFSVVMLLRIAFVGVAPFPMGALPLDPMAMAIFNLVVFVHAFFLGFLLISLTNERREAEQRSFALIDPLTGVLNRRAFMAELERSGRRRKHQGRGDPVSLLVLDLDHFKTINDRYGHSVGDRVLVNFAGLAEACARRADQLYRIGGEEFCFILPATTRNQAADMAEAIRRACATSFLQVGAERVSYTVSIGVASTEGMGVSLEDLINAADAAVYEAKARGRSRVVVADAAGTNVHALRGDRGILRTA